MEEQISSSFTQKLLVRKSRVILFLVIAIFSFSIDLSSKWYAGHTFNDAGCPYPSCQDAVFSFGHKCLNVSSPNYAAEPPRYLIENFFSIHLLNNTGSAFSFLAGHNNFFILFNVLFLAAAVYFMTRKKEIPLLPLLAFSMIIGGGMGNFYDRLVHNSVRDFLSFRFPIPWGSYYDYPVFNMADVFICTGAFLYLLDQFVFCKSTKNEISQDTNLAEEKK